MRKLLTITTFLLLCAAPSYAQDAPIKLADSAKFGWSKGTEPKPIILTDTESQQWSTFTAREKSATDALNRAMVGRSRKQ